MNDKVSVLDMAMASSRFVCPEPPCSASSRNAYPLLHPIFSSPVRRSPCRIACSSGDFSFTESSAPTSLKNPHDSPFPASTSFDDSDRKIQEPLASEESPKEIVKASSDDSLSLFPAGFLDDVSIKNLDWVTIVPNHMLPRGDRLVLDHNGEAVMLFWFEDKIYAISNTSPAASGTKLRLSDAEITEEGIIICPHTQSKFDIRTGATVDWLPNESLLAKIWTPPISDLTVYAVKVSPDHIYINTNPSMVGGYYALAEFSGNRISTDPNYEKPIIFDDLKIEFGFTPENEIENGRAAMLGFLTLILIEIATGEGFLKVSGILDWLYQYLPGFPLLRY